MKLFRYVDANGNFDYKKYRAAQEAGNIKKINNVWANESVIQYLSGFARLNISNIKFGLCHGTRRGLEQQWFSKYTNAPFIGTEISSTAAEFDNTIQWDFHEAKEEWLGNTSIVYSNSWDHSYDPHKCFRAWMSCLEPGGMLMLEHARQHWDDQASELDPFGISLPELVVLLTEIGGGAYFVRTILSDFPGDRPKHLQRLNVVVVERARHALWMPKLPY